MSNFILFFISAIGLLLWACLLIWNWVCSLQMSVAKILTLIPKVQYLKSISWFLHILLCNLDFKLVSKVLVNRMKIAFLFLVSQNQSSFILGRHLHNNIIIMQHVVHSMRNKVPRPYCIVFKVDLEKAYDRLQTTLGFSIGDSSSSANPY